MNVAALAIFVVTIGTSLIALYRAPALLHTGMFRPFLVRRGRRLDTLVTSGFLHADVGHLIFNMITYYFFAFPLAAFFGSARFLALYGCALVLSNLCTLRKHHADPDYASLGASGAISAVLFAYILYFPAATLLVFPIPFPLPAPLVAVGFVAYSYYAASHVRGRINHDAHLCGALSGVGFVAITDPALITGYLGVVSG